MPRLKLPRIKLPHLKLAGKLPDKLASAAPKRLTLPLIISGIIVVFVIAGILVVIHSNSEAKAEKATETAALDLPDSFTTGLSPLELSAPLVPPEEPGIPEGYLLWRTRREAWDDTEAERWFVPTGESAIKDLHKANQELIDDLLRSAP